MIITNKLPRRRQRMNPMTFIVIVAVGTLLTIPLFFWIDLKSGWTGAMTLINTTLIVMVGSIMRLIIAPKQEVLPPINPRFKGMIEYIRKGKDEYRESRRKLREQKLKLLVIIVFGVIALIPAGIHYAFPTNIC